MVQSLVQFIDITCANVHATALFEAKDADDRRRHRFF
ncbi:MAG: hypothetical protein ACI9U6_002960, partial [Loktanella salsilacus]